MKPFHYHQDPLYGAAAAILAGQTVTEEAAQLDEGIPYYGWQTTSRKKTYVSIKNRQVFAALLGKKVHHGSPGYPTKEVIAGIKPHQTKKRSFEVKFKSGAFAVLSQGELDELMQVGEVFYKSPHGGRSVIELQEGVELEEGYKVGFPLSKKAIKAATDLDPDEFKEFLGGMANYFYEVADADGTGDFGRSFIIKTAMHFEKAYKDWKI